MSNPNIQNLIERRDRALAAFATLGDLRPGSLVENYRSKFLYSRCIASVLDFLRLP